MCCGPYYMATTASVPMYPDGYPTNRNVVTGFTGLFGSAMDQYEVAVPLATAGTCARRVQSKMEELFPPRLTWLRPRKGFFAPMLAGPDRC